MGGGTTIKRAVAIMAVLVGAATIATFLSTRQSNEIQLADNSLATEADTPDSSLPATTLQRATPNENLPAEDSTRVTNQAQGSDDAVGTVSASSTFNEHCGPSTRLSNGTIINVSTNAEAQSAINSAAPGTVIRLAAGIYTGGLVIEGVSGTAAAPIIIETQPDAYRQAHLQHPGQTALRILNSSHVYVRNLQISNARFGILANGFQEGKIENNHIHDLIWKAIQVSQVNSDRQITGRPSLNVEVACNLIHDTGIPDGYTNGHNGEGIYAGSGFAFGDRTSGITIIYNEIHSTTGEAIELKPLVTNSEVLFNKVYDIRLVDEGNGGAIAAQLTRELGGFTDIVGNPNIRIQGNRVWNVSRTDQAFKSQGGSGQWRWSAANALRVGGPAIITENLFWNTQDAAIKIQDIYGKDGLYNNVEVSRNIVNNASTNPLNSTGAIVNDPGVLSVNLFDNLFDQPESAFPNISTEDMDQGRDLIPDQVGFEHLDDNYFW